MKKAVVTGGSGFLGSALVGELYARNYEVVVLDITIDPIWPVQYVNCSILGSSKLVEKFAGADVIYHMAGTLGTSELNSHINHSVEVNITGSLNVFNAAIIAGVKRVFFPSKPNPWVNSYSITKAAVDGYSRLYNEEKPIRISSLRYFNAYGPRQHMVPVRKIIPYFAAQAMLGMPLEVFGDGEQTTDMIYSQDVARITVEFMERDYIDGIPELGRGIPVTVNQIAREVNDYFGNRGGIVHREMRRGETPNTKLVADIRLLQSIVGDLHFVDWKTSLCDTLSYYKALPSHYLGETARFYNWIKEP